MMIYNIVILATFSLILLTKCELEMKGMTYSSDRYCNNVTFDDPRSLRSLYHLRTTGTNYIALVITEYTKAGQDENEVFPIYDPPFPTSTDNYYIHKTAKIEEVKAITKYAHKLGMKVLFKPHIDVIE